ncbi:type II toxin-antitoxin system prevent-host-death family antitoxin [Photorhabdus noenieputensis]|uniref:type II toxin-antitoxin system Phd/YefM family antitoxin n=1 Tax=Photorhabdus noenieputensis TaxID=1208607 RepID=UPI001BD4CABE|nr:type II toxin-antitoxin system prevent-host-death family antitoxin [Photorhabdus noenieputensis]MBS9435711.1 type II toxin-antitoxin system prevent-host-death family antitoxin [Photorhabdus noenieputensis]MCK3667728.1 type II toxin-antitoxin system prevent-host-death family antitoxin [Photorhabdus noenieputensis]
MTIQTNIREVKSNLSQLADKAVSGEVIIIAKAGKPYVQIVPIAQPDRVPGGFEDLITIGEDFFDADREIQLMFEGSK